MYRLIDRQTDRYQMDKQNQEQRSRSQKPLFFTSIRNTETDAHKNNHQKIDKRQKTSRLTIIIVNTQVN